MDAQKTGLLIRRLRLEKGYTQCALARQLHVSDKTVSKWERGQGFPDISLFSPLMQVLGIDLDGMLRGETEENERVGGNMKKLKFYVCSDCGNLVTATGEASVFCCGKKLEALTPQKAEEGEKLHVEQVEDEYFITSGHEMTKEHYIDFIALLRGDRMTLIKQYPEWNLETRVPQRGHGTLLWHCSRHGLFFQYI